MLQYAAGPWSGGLWTGADAVGVRGTYDFPVSQQQSAPDVSRFRTSPVSFASRSGRLTTGQQRAWDTRRDIYLVEVPRHFGRMSVDPAWRFDAAEVFGRTAPLVLEIGSGQGDAIVTAAAADPDRDHLAVEVYRPGVAQVMVRADRAARERTGGADRMGEPGDTGRAVDGSGSGEAGESVDGGGADDTVEGVDGGVLGRVAVGEALAQRSAEPEGPGLTNLRVMQVNAAELLDTAIPAGSLDEVWTFFPDPWHKSRHRKRRLVAPAFAEKVVRGLRPGGVWRLATDWAEYAEQMLDVLEAAPGLRNAHGPRAAAPRFDGRVITGFERKAHKAGRDITDLTYVRV